MRRNAAIERLKSTRDSGSGYNPTNIHMCSRSLTHQSHGAVIYTYFYAHFRGVRMENGESSMVGRISTILDKWQHESSQRQDAPNDLGEYLSHVPRQGTSHRLGVFQAKAYGMDDQDNYVLRLGIWHGLDVWQVESFGMRHVCQDGAQT
ncbi:unnamed protein product [Lupinus luteus]|uniref:Uncharacterized protein n=1 Tax=Lupinus luteus TaxID=3873 RepID=A0AAV1VSR6_LUPLU